MRREKGYLLEEINNRIFEGSGLVLVRYGTMKANQANDFRLKLRKAGGTYFVAKKRMLKKAAAEKGMNFDISLLRGNVGFIVAEENFLEATKALYAYKSETKDLIEVLGGHFDGQVCNATQMEAVSKLPTLPELRAQFLATLEAPMATTLSVMEAVLTSVIYCLDNKAKDQK